MRSSDCPPCLEGHFEWPLIALRYLVRSREHGWLSTVSPLTCLDVPPPVHRRGFSVLRLCALPLCLQPSPSLSRLGPLCAGSPVSTAGYCSRCLIGRSLALRPANSSCTLDWDRR